MTKGKKCLCVKIRCNYDAITNVSKWKQQISVFGDYECTLILTEL